jgi:hypothetical protein
MKTNDKSITLKIPAPCTFGLHTRKSSDDVYPTCYMSGNSEDWPMVVGDIASTTLRKILDQKLVGPDAVGSTINPL